MHHNPNYTEEELKNLENMLLSPNEASIDLALELIRNNGFHYQLERPLALLVLIQPDISSEVKNRIEKIFKNLYLIIGVIPALFIVSLIIFHYYSTTLIGYEPSINFPYYYIQNDFNFNLLKLIFIW